MGFKFKLIGEAFVVGRKKERKKQANLLVCGNVIFFFLVFSMNLIIHDLARSKAHKTLKIISNISFHMPLRPIKYPEGFYYVLVVCLLTFRFCFQFHCLESSLSAKLSYKKREPSKAYPSFDSPSLSVHSF